MPRAWRGIGWKSVLCGFTIKCAAAVIFAATRTLAIHDSASCIIAPSVAFMPRRVRFVFDPTLYSYIPSPLLAVPDWRVQWVNPE